MSRRILSSAISYCRNPFSQDTRNSSFFKSIFGGKDKSTCSGKEEVSDSNELKTPNLNAVSIPCCPGQKPPSVPNACGIYKSLEWFDPTHNVLPPKIKKVLMESAPSVFPTPEMCSKKSPVLPPKPPASAKPSAECPKGDFFTLPSCPMPCVASPCPPKPPCCPPPKPPCCPPPPPCPCPPPPKCPPPPCPPPPKCPPPCPPPPKCPPPCPPPKCPPPCPPPPKCPPPCPPPKCPPPCPPPPKCPPPCPPPPKCPPPCPPPPKCPPPCPPPPKCPPPCPPPKCPPPCPPPPKCPPPCPPPPKCPPPCPPPKKCSSLSDPELMALNNFTSSGGSLLNFSSLNMLSSSLLQTIFMSGGIKDFVRVSPNPNESLNTVPYWTKPTENTPRSINVDDILKTVSPKDLVKGFKLFDRKKSFEKRENGATVTLNDIKMRREGESENKISRRFSFPNFVTTPTRKLTGNPVADFFDHSSTLKHLENVKPFPLRKTGSQMNKRTV